MAAFGFRYHDVAADPERDYRQMMLRGKPYVFVNYFPFPVKIYITEDPQVFPFPKPAQLDLVGEIAGGGELAATHSRGGVILGLGMTLHATIQVGGGGSHAGPEYEFIDAAALFDDTRQVRIGDVLREVRFTQFGQRSHTDLPGIWVVNHLTMPINVYYQGRKLNYIAGSDGLGFHSGGASEAFVDNVGTGLNMGDELTITIVMSPTWEVKYLTMLINDSYASHYHVGMISQKFDLARRDSVGYRIDEPNIVGQRYLHHVDGEAYASVYR